MKELNNNTNISSDDIVRAFLSRRVLPLQRRTHKIGQMCGRRDPTRITTIGLRKSDVVLKAKQICKTQMLADWTWGDVWQDSVIGVGAPGTFNNTDFPIVTNNLGSLTERWAIRFTNSTTFQVIGEHVGVIGVGNTSTECAPINTKNGEPYFTIDPLGWGAGWQTGNALRFNTIGATYPVWVIRTVKQGSPTEYDDKFSLLARGNVDAP
jgi:hypothetical protein